MLDETRYHEIADATLTQLEERLYAADAKGDLDIDLHDGVLNVEFPTGNVLVINKHTPTRQIWIAAPIGGALYANWKNEQWQLKDGRLFTDWFERELRALGVQL